LQCQILTDREILFSVDIDECSEGLDDCQRDKYFCFNTEGNYTCQPQHPSKCPAGYKYNKAAATCEGNVLALRSFITIFICSADTNRKV
jgi:hypothetical protein